MKFKLFLLLIFLFVICSLLTGICNAQWQPDVRLTNDPATSYTSHNNSWCIASSGDFVHVVWYDKRDGNEEIFYKRSTDGGISWEADTRLTNNFATSRFPSITVSGSIVHVVWTDYRDGNEEIYYKRSTDGGIVWGEDKRLSDYPVRSTLPSVAVSGSNVHVVWFDDRDGDGEIYYKHSTDGGTSWGTDTRLTNYSSSSQSPSVSVSGSVVHVVWVDFRDGNSEIYYKRSTDGGIIWGIDIRLTINTQISNNTSVSVSGVVVHVVWKDYRDGGDGEIYYKRSTDGGVTWGADTRLTNNSAYSDDPSISVSGSVVHVVWSDNRDGNSEIYYKQSTDGGISWGSDTRLTNATSGSYSPSISVSGSVVHVVWYDERDGISEIYYKRDPTGNPIGIQPISNEIPKAFSLSQNYPNPFNPTTKIKFEIPNSKYETNSKTEIRIYDVLGIEIAVLLDEQLKPGTYEVEWNASNYPSGVYYYRIAFHSDKLSAEDYTETKKMVLVK